MSKKPASLQRLAELVREGPSLREMFKAHIILENADDRTAALMRVVDLEEVLQVSIARRLEPLNETEAKELFRHNGPIATLSAKIAMGRALGIYGRKTRKDLDRVREIRNAFAHSSSDLSFDTPEVSAACADFDLFKRLDAKDAHANYWPPHNAREQYLSVILHYETAMIGVWNREASTYLD